MTSRLRPWSSDSGGPGPVLVLLHAFPLSSVMYERLVPLVAPRARVICVDLPGLGRSGIPEADASVAEMARAVVGVLDDLDVERATVMGISTGGYVALAVAELAPERVTSLVLGSTTCRVIAPDVPAERRDLASTLERTGVLEPVIGAAAQGLGPTALREQPDLHPLLLDVVGSADPDGVAWAARAIASRADTSSVLADFPGPVLLLFGSEDDDTPPARGAEMRDLRPSTTATTLVVLPETGHLTALERPCAVAAVLDGFLPAAP